MLTSPLTVTIATVAKSLVRINQDNFSSTYRYKAANEEITLTIRNSYEGKAGTAQYERHNIDMVRTLWDANGVPTVTQSYHVFRTPRNVDVQRVVDELKGLNTLSSANALLIGGWES